MSDNVTKEEMLEFMDWIGGHASLHDRNEQWKAIRSLIENMDKQTEVDEERIKKENLANERAWKIAVRETYDEGYEKGYREGRRGVPNE